MFGEAGSVHDGVCGSDRSAADFDRLAGSGKNREKGNKGKAFPSRELIFVRARRFSTLRNAFFCVHITSPHFRKIRTILFHAHHVSVGGFWSPLGLIPAAREGLMHPRANRPTKGYPKAGVSTQVAVRCYIIAPALALPPLVAP